MPFQFVDQSDIKNTKERKLIRSHVMKGKNLGKKRPRREKRSESTAEKSTTAHRTGSAPSPSGNESALATSGRRTQCESPVLAVTRQLANDFSLLFPTKGVASHTMLHLQQLCFYILDVTSPAEFCRSTGVFEWIWFQLAFYNKAYFHCTIAIASACAAFLSGDSGHSPIALCHMSETYRLVNQQLSSNKTVSDTTVAVVASVNIYDRLYGDPEKAMVHHNGLASLIALRGGIRELAKRNFVISEKAFRSDIELALHCGSNPKFSSQDVPRHLILIDPRGYPEPYKHKDAELADSILYLSVCPELCGVVLDILRFSHVLDQASRADKLDPAAYQTTLIYVGYRLLETKLPRYVSGANTNFDVLVHLALTGFHNTFCFGVGRKLLRFPFLMERFELAARAISISDGDRSRQMVIFWVLLVGRLSSLTHGDDLWLVSKLKALASELGVRTWPEVSNALRSFPWVKAAHEAQGEEFWNTEIGRALPLNSCTLPHDSLPI
ncbi:hypothetical protein ANO14919_075300 [Xylariales sp. No.14919]|nr:hypothetical protein ANO14919_075300 [Xylariales sp. No.14919]